MCSEDSSKPVPHQIFISHRMEDREIAMAIKNGLEDVAGEKICVHVCTKNQGVQDWKKDIEKAIEGSITMVFLYTVEQEEAWRWCMYEIGLYKGLMLHDKKRQLICIKNSYLKELPSPLRGGIEPYATGPEDNGIDTFCDDLLFSTKFTDHKLLRDPSSDDEKKRAKAVEKITRKFERSRLEVEYYDRRVTIKLTDNQNRVVENVEDAIINDSGSTMEELFGKEDGVSWKELYTKLKRSKQTKWLEQLKKNIHAIESKDAYEKDLAPIRIKQNGENISYIPLISTIVKNRISEKNENGDRKWFEVTKLNIIFVKQTISRENLLKSIPTLIPFSKIKMFLDFDATTHTRILEIDDKGKPREPVVEEMNQMCLDLFAIGKEEFEQNKKDGKQWTTSYLIKRLKDFNFVDEENLKKLGDDQDRVVKKIVFQGRLKTEAWIPIAFNENHDDPTFRNQCFLPCLSSMQTEGNRDGKQEATLLVGYIRDFWPPNHKNNPLNRSSIAETE